MAAFAQAIAASGALGSLVYLGLRNNRIGDEGMKAFSSAIASGALAQLTYLFVYGNPTSEAARQEAEDAIINRE
eukprot:4784620-Prymnesium_polylepis.1